MTMRINRDGWVEDTNHFDYVRDVEGKVQATICRACGAFIAYEPEHAAWHQRLADDMGEIRLFRGFS